MVTHHVWWTGVASRAHLIYGASWLRQIPGEVSVVVFPFRQFLDAPALDLDDARAVMPPNVVDVKRFDVAQAVPAGARAALLSVGAVGIKPWLTVLRAAGLRRIPVVVTDEGFGSYGDFASRREAWRREGVPEPWRSVRTAAVRGASRLLTSTPWLLHERKAGHWRLNQAVAEEFRRYARPERADGGAVFLSQPWPELGVVTESEYLTHIDKVADACAGAGLSFTVHPHPAENPARYSGWAVHGHKQLAELDPSILNATVLLGATSTAMLNIAAIHGVPAMRVGLEELSDAGLGHSRAQNSLLARYLGDVLPPEAWRDKLTEFKTASGQNGK